MASAAIDQGPSFGDHAVALRTGDNAVAVRTNASVVEEDSSYDSRMDISSDDEKERAAFLTEGQQNLRDAEMSGSKKYPRDILNIYLKAYALVRARWTRSGAVQTAWHKGVFDEVNAETMQWHNSHEMQNHYHTNPYEFPIAHIDGLLTVLKDGLIQMQAAGGKDTSVLQNLALGITQGSEPLLQKGILPKLFMPDDLKTDLMILFRSLETFEPAAAAERLRILLFPVEEQANYVNRISRALGGYLDSVRAQNSDAAKLYENLKNFDTSLKLVNTMVGLNEDDHRLPSTIWSKLLSYQEIDREKLETSLSADLPSLRVCLRTMGYVSTGFSALDKTESTDPRAPDDLIKNLLSPASNTRRIDLDPSMSEPSKPSVSLQDLYDIEPPVCQGDITHLGKIMYISRIGAFGSRAIVDAGTEECPHYKTFPGSAFPKLALLDLAATEKYVLPKRDPAQPKPKATDLKSIRFGWQVPRRTKPDPQKADPTKRRSTPPRYFMLKWNDGTEEIVNATFLISIFGKIHANSMAEKVLKQFREREQIFQKAKEAGLYPGTERALTAEDVARYPHLAPEDVSSDSESDASEWDHPL